MINFYIPDTTPWNPYLDSPAFYLGARQGAYQVDAGVDYDVRYSPGYEAVIESNNSATAPRVWNKSTSKWEIKRIPKATNNQFTLDFAVEPDTGLVRLYVSGLGTFYWTDPAETPPPLNLSNLTVWPDRTAASAAPPRSSTATYPVFDPTQINQIQVKRVVAMNRVGNPVKVGGPSHVHAEPQYDDGSFMYVAVSNAQLRKIASTSPTVILSPFALWGPDDTNQTPTAALSATGYDSPSNTSPVAKDLLDAHLHPISDSSYYHGGSQWRVNFPQTYCGYDFPANPDLYVEANLNAARTQGQASWTGTVSADHRISRYTQSM